MAKAFKCDGCGQLFTTAPEKENRELQVFAEELGQMFNLSMTLAPTTVNDFDLCSFCYQLIAEAAWARHARVHLRSTGRP